MKKNECFKIQLKRIVNDNFSNGEEIYKIPCSSYFTFFKEPISIVADPFLFVRHDTLYLFYECKNLYHDAIICMVCTKDLRKWTKPVIVLKESFHLSYPFVFEYQGEVYMIPETCAVNEVRLYKAENDKLESFRYLKTLIRDQNQENDIDISYSDSSVFLYNGMWYLFTTINKKGINELYLYFSENFDGPYEKHIKSPIIRSQKYGRNGGSLIECNSSLFRVAQDCVDKYGDNVHLLKILKISENVYEETVCKEYIFNKEIEFYKCGGHHLNIVEFKKQKIIATDAKEYHYFCGARILHKLGFWRK
mgnify:CR=1 FL=1